MWLYAAPNFVHFFMRVLSAYKLYKKKTILKKIKIKKKKTYFTLLILSIH